MQLVIAFVFAAVFGIVALLITAASKPRAARATEATLASAIKVASGLKVEDVDVRKEDRFSSIPWLHRLLSGVDFGTNLRDRLIQADLSWSPGKLLLASGAFFAVATYLGSRRMHSTGMGLLFGLLAAAGPFLYVARKRSRRMRQMQMKLPEALDLMVSALRAGHSMGGALGAASKEAPEPVGREFRICFEEQNFGIDLRTAVDNLMRRVPLQDVRMLSTAMLIHKESGGNLAEVLDKTAEVMRDRVRLEQQIRVHTAQGRLSGLILSILPAGMGLLLYIVNPSYMNVLFTRELGHKLLIGAAGMNLLGLMVIRKIIRIQV